MKKFLEYSWLLFCVIVILVIPVVGARDFGSGLLVGIAMMYVIRFIRDIA